MSVLTVIYYFGNWCNRDKFSLGRKKEWVSAYKNFVRNDIVDKIRNSTVRLLTQSELKVLGTIRKL